MALIKIEMLLEIDDNVATQLIDDEDDDLCTHWEDRVDDFLDATDSSLISFEWKRVLN